MKKGGTAILLTVTAIFVAFTAGLFLGRYVSNQPVNVQPIKTEYITDSNDTIRKPEGKDSGKININTASAVLLDTLPGIGPVLAERIVDYRIQNGPFGSAEDIGLVEGIGSKTLLEILDLITVEG